MRFLLVDNSNSRTKLILSDELQHIGELVRVPTAEVSTERIAQEIGGWQFDAVMVCSVVPSKASILQNYFTGTPFHLLNHKSDHGIKISVTNPEQLGADRIANAIGVNALFSPPVVVVDFGTAVTFDIIDHGGEYLGGVIAPGLGSMNDYLFNKTALLPQIVIKEPERAIGKSTVEAMVSGVVHGYRGLVRGILAAIEEDLGRKPFVISTGGDGRVIANGMPEIDEFSSQITLEGLRVAAVRTFSNKEGVI